MYIVKMWGCTEPEIHGPFASEELRIAAAKELEGQEDCISRLDVDSCGIPSVSCFTNVEMEE